MPKLNGAVPKYRKHKASGQAIVTIDGADHYLGKFGSNASRMLYDRLIGEWLARGRVSKPVESEGFIVLELVARFWKFAEGHYPNESIFGGHVSTITSTETRYNVSWKNLL